MILTPQEFLQKCNLPYEAKVNHAIIRAREFYNQLQGEVFCSVGGLDSITLLTLLRQEVSRDIPGVSVSSLEDRSIQRIHKSFDNFTTPKPLKTKVQVLREHGFPVISKEKAGKIQKIQNPTEENATVRHAIMTGETGKQGGYKTKETGSRMRLPQKWLNLFGGPENERYGTNYKTAPFKVSADCCYYMKEKPCEDYARKSGRKPYMGLMASEGGQRRFALVRHGCNYFGKTVVRSAPFAIFSRQDILRLALDMNYGWKNGGKEAAEIKARDEGRLAEDEYFPESLIPEIYGTIEQDENGQLYTTKAQRTGCSMCGFGIHIEPRPHRFDRLREANLKEWRFWMYDMGWGKVLDYIGVGWKDRPLTREELIGQASLF